MVKERVKSHLEGLQEGQIRMRQSTTEKSGFWAVSDLIDKINMAAEFIGKDGKFQLFVCVSIRDHTFQKWLPMIASNLITAQMYEEKSFMRDNDHIMSITRILDTLNDFKIVLESSLVRGLDI